MKKYHNGANGPASCTAAVRSCPLGHFDTREQAQAAYDSLMESKYGALANVTNEIEVDKDPYVNQGLLERKFRDNMPMYRKAFLKEHSRGRRAILSSIDEYDDYLVVQWETQYALHSQLGYIDKNGDLNFTNQKSPSEVSTQEYDILVSRLDESELAEHNESLSHLNSLDKKSLALNKEVNRLKRHSIDCNDKLNSRLEDGRIDELNSSLSDYVSNDDKFIEFASYDGVANEIKALTKDRSDNESMRKFDVISNKIIVGNFSSYEPFGRSRNKVPTRRYYALTNDGLQELYSTKKNERMNIPNNYKVPAKMNNLYKLEDERDNTSSQLGELEDEERILLRDKMEKRQLLQNNLFAKSGKKGYNIE